MGDQKIEWKLQEALWEFAPEELLTKCRDARKSWQDAGAPKRFVRFSTSVRSGESAASNWAQQHGRRTYLEQKACSWQLWEALRTELVSGRLEATGSPASANAEPVPIRASAWLSAKVLSWRLSTISIDGSPPTKFFQVRIRLAAVRLTELKEAAKICDETAFQKLLERDMRASPDRRLKSNQEYLEEAKKMGLKLGPVGFRRVLRAALAETKAFGWSRPGPIRKSTGPEDRNARDHNAKRS
jgi:hypothetical protein